LKEKTHLLAITRGSRSLLVIYLNKRESFRKEKKKKKKEKKEKKKKEKKEKKEKERERKKSCPWHNLAEEVVDPF